MNYKDMTDTCENCGRPTPGRWICDDCFPYFDGDRFTATPEEIGIDDSPQENS